MDGDRTWRNRFLDSSHGRIVAILQRGASTADEMAAELGVTPAAVRAHITTMERDGIVRRTGRRSGATRPSQMFELTPEVEQLLSGAYIPLLIELMRQCTARIKPKELRELMQSAGRGLAATFPRTTDADAPFATQVHDVAARLNTQLGTTMKIEKHNGHHILRGYGCPLAALTGSHPAVCLAIESLIATLLDADVRECCNREERPTCCFDVAPKHSSRPSVAGRQRPR
jgi:DeoR family transcriptional regulator, suf operon transcriptional repressor